MSLFKIPIIHECPHTGPARGVLHLSHAVIGALAGAVWDKDEWMALLIGKRSKDGMLVSVDQLRVPEQRRNSSNCELVNREPLEKDVVGVVHSHHSMTAFFSATDINQLNPRFPLSIVIAQPRSDSSETERLLGFNYKAEGRTALPCGDLGVISFTVIPMPLLDEWPIKLEPHYGEPNLKASMQYCDRADHKLDGIKRSICTTECGLSIDQPAMAIFGIDSNDFMTEIEVATKSRHIPSGYEGVYNGYKVTDKRIRSYGQDYDRDDDRDWLKSWNAYGEG